MSDAVSCNMKVSKEEREAVNLVEELTDWGYKARVVWKSGYPVEVQQMNGIWVPYIKEVK